MIFQIRWASGDKEATEIEINSLGDLLDLIDKEGEVVVSKTSIVVYDDYLE